MLKHSNKHIFKKFRYIFNDSLEKKIEIKTYPSNSYVVNPIKGTNHVVDFKLLFNFVSLLFI